MASLRASAALAAGLLVCGLAGGGEAASLRLCRAYLRSGEIELDSCGTGLFLGDTISGELPIDWAETARANFRDFPLDHPDPVQIEANRSDYNTSTFEYSAPLPASLSKISAYVLGSDGLSPVVMTGLRGEITYRLDEKHRVYGEPLLLGRVLLEPPREQGAPGDAGFAVLSDHPLQWRAHALALGNQAEAHIQTREDAQGIVYAYVDAEGMSRDLITRTAKDPALRSAQRFEIEGVAESYLLLRWVEDFCESAYDLLVVDAESVRHPGENSYGCDP